MGFVVVACLPYGRGGVAFLKKLGASFSQDPPPPLGHWWVSFVPIYSRRRRCRKIFSLYFPLCGLGGLVGVPLEVDPPPPHRGRPRALAKKWMGAFLI